MSNTRSRDNDVRHTRHAATTETKPAFKTTELIAYLLAVIGVLIASSRYRTRYPAPWGDEKLTCRLTAARKRS